MDGNEVDCNEYIKNLVIDEGLFLSGHYRMNDNISARDWINMEGLFALTNDRFLEPITCCIKDFIGENKDDICIVGVNHYGAILASVLGYKYEIAFNYCFDNSKIVDSSEQTMIKSEKKRILLIVDVMVYGEALCNLIYNMTQDGIVDNDTEIEAIVLFERRISENFYSSVYANENVKKVYVLNDSFPIEICKKDRDECIFRKNKKIAKYAEPIK